MEPISLMLVDDNPNFLRAERHFLERDEAVRIIGEATGGAEVLDRVKSLRPQVILLDLAMPDLSGLQLLPQLREEHPGIGIIALTVMDTAIYEKAAMLAGADAFLSKSNLFTDLIPTIQRVAAMDRAIGSSG